MEELRGQLAEALPGSVAAMMRAAGFTNEKDFFKAVEAGQIMANDVLPKFAVELKKVANTNGALTLATQKTRAEMNRFFNELTYAKDSIFQAGMAKGLNYMFGTLSDILKDLAPVSKAFGQAFQGALTTVSAAVKILLSPLNILVEAFGLLGFTDKTTGAIWQVVGSGGALYLMARGFQAITVAITGTNIALLTTLRRMAMLATPLFVAEDLYVGAKGGKSALASGGSLSAGNLVGQSWMDRYGVFWGNQRMANGETQLRITFDSEEAKKFVEVTATGVTQKQQATLASETGG